MLNDSSYKTLLRKLDKRILHHGNGKPFVSPTHRRLHGEQSPPGVIYYDMGIEHLSSSELQMLHVNLHRFYPRGVNNVDKRELERLHKLVKEKLNHKDFDKLDQSDYNE